MRVARSTDDVPAGPYCADYSKRDGACCPHLRLTVTQIGWADGLGSPGPLDNYACGFFGTAGHHTQRTQTNAVRVLKCAECVAQSPEGREGTAPPVDEFVSVCAECGGKWVGGRQVISGAPACRYCKPSAASVAAPDQNREGK